ncbi:hypothetical protein DFQ28_009032 [Apophysomyces sp. BC1034]|nr:hypothetical protein DFQ30_008709 [Apophysomyces sp. BC1015]KAG0173866.1 hypothetical protein DFQ29_007703 [Apophysomyces sp. BC1021]KAG0185641.1 hypothetical protein DFQ28_009032 [Apophysomyces sp. BC1034]
MFTFGLFRPAASVVEGIRPLATRTGLWNGQRLFSNSATCMNDEKTPEETELKVDEAASASAEPEAEAEPIKLSRRRRRFHEWTAGAGAKFSRPSKGTTNYLGSTPFPNNPLFRPRPPLSDESRQKIYDAYKANPEISVRQLASKFYLSLKRVEAILKLKAAEEEMMANGFVLQKKFAKGMEELMGCESKVITVQEPLVDIFPSVNKPKFQRMEENATFTPKDAADVLNRKPYDELVKRAISEEEAKFNFKLPSTTESTPIVESSAKRSKFLIVDTSS